MAADKPESEPSKRKGVLGMISSIVREILLKIPEILAYKAPVAATVVVASLGGVSGGRLASTTTGNEYNRCIELMETMKYENGVLNGLLRERNRKIYSLEIKNKQLQHEIEIDSTIILFSCIDLPELLSECLQAQP